MSIKATVVSIIIIIIIIIISSSSSNSRGMNSVITRLVWLL